MGAVAALETLKRHDKGEEVPGFLNTLLGSHPLTSERIETARKLAPTIPFQRSRRDRRNSRCRSRLSR